ncbi:MAG: cell division protein SepF [Lachnospiraceae bacterium]|nr:cell division protein SepF [Lachnospiraceae bacterium]
MGLMDNFISAMKLGDGEEYDDDEYLDEPDERESDQPRISKLSSSEGGSEESSRKPVLSKPNMNRVRKTGNGMEVCVIKPTSFEESREITDTLLANRTVVLNMEGLEVNLAQRIIDFASGSCYAIHGNLQKISHYIFIITPASVDISGDFQDILSGSFEVPSL